MRDPLKMARDGASYAKYRLQAVGAPMAVVFDGERVCCLDARSRRVEQLAQVAPERIAGVYQPGIDREAIVEDLLIVLG